jgi:hypothetical protein
MRKIASAAVAVALAGVMALPAPASAASASFNIQFGQQDRFVGNYCDRHPTWRGCDDWRKNHHHWGKADYMRWYRWNQPSFGNVAAGLFGFAVGAAIANGVNSRSTVVYDSHVAACEARYRSYSAETDMYLGYDGDYHRCRL